MTGKKAGCDRCQALLANSGRRCRNLAQCRARSAYHDVALCNVHEEYVRRHGIDSLQYDVDHEPEKQKQRSSLASLRQFPPLPRDLPPPPTSAKGAPLPAVDVSDDLRRLASVQAEQQQQIDNLLKRLREQADAHQLQQKSNQTLDSGTALGRQLQELANAQREQRDAIRDLSTALRQLVASAKVQTEDRVAPAVAVQSTPMPIAAIARALKRISQTQEAHSANLQRLSSRIDTLQGSIGSLPERIEAREQRESVAAIAPTAYSPMPSRRESPAPEAQTAAPDTTETKVEATKPVAPPQPIALVRRVRHLQEYVQGLVDRVEQTARAAHGEIGTLRSLAETFCQRRMTHEQIESELQPLKTLLDRIDSLIASVRNEIVRANSAASSNNAKFDVSRILFGYLAQNSREQRTLQEDLERISEKVRKRFEKRCRQKRFAFAPALRFAQEVLSGKVRCNKKALPVALRNWFVTGATAAQNGANSIAYNWTDRKLLCNLSDLKDEDETEQDSENDDSDLQSAPPTSAFERGQSLRDDFKVFDVRGQVVAIGRQSQLEEKGDDDDRGASNANVAFDQQSSNAQQSAAASAARMASLLQQYVRLLDTLNLLIDLYAVASRDTRGLAAERQSVRQSVANLALKAGREQALQFMSAERYELLMLQASLVSAYAPYLETEEGIAELASLAAFEASESARADGVSAPVRRQVARQTYAQSLSALTLIGASGTLASTLWLMFAAAPRTPAPIVPSMPRAAPPVGRYSPPFSAPALPLPAMDAYPAQADKGALPAPRSNDAALPFVFREQSRANQEARAHHSVAQLAQQTARDAAAIESLLPIDGARIKLAGLFNETRTFGGRQLPLTRSQWRREQLDSTLELLSPSSRHIERLYERVRLGSARVRSQLQARFEAQARQRVQRLRGAATLELPGGASSPAGVQPSAPLFLPPEGDLYEGLGPSGPQSMLPADQRADEQPLLPLFLPPSGALYDTVGPSGPQSMLPGAVSGAASGAAANVAITAPSAIGQLANNANLLSVIAQAMGPAPPLALDFDPAVQRLMQARGYNVTDADEILAANADMFRDRATVLRNYQRGLGALQKYRAQRYSPSAAARQREPQSAAALASAAEAAMRAVEENPDDFFDELAAPALGDAAERVHRNNSLSAIEETPLHFLQQSAGVLGSGGGVTGSDVQRMAERVDSVAGGFANSTALDLHLDRMFERYRASGAAARQIGMDANMLVAAADDSGVALRDFRLRNAGRMSAEQRRQTERAVDAAARLAEREFGGGAQVQREASVALKVREVRNLFAQDAAALHGFIAALVEKAYEVEVAALEKANQSMHVFAKLVSRVGAVSIDQAALVVDSMADALAKVGAASIESLKTREQVDRLMKETLSRELSDAIGEERVRYIVEAALDGLAETGRVSSRAGERVAAALQSHTRDAAAVVGDVTVRLSAALSENGRAWSQYGQEQARAALRVLGRAGQQTLDETSRILNDLQREAPEVWRNEVLPRFQRAERLYKQQVNYLARNYMPAADASEAQRVQAALDVRERGLQALAELQQTERTLLEDIDERLSKRYRATVEEQRQSLAAMARMRGLQRAELERRMRAARHAEFARLANVAMLAPPETKIYVDAPPETRSASAAARGRVLFNAATQSAHYAEWEREMRAGAAAERKREQAADDIVAANAAAQVENEEIDVLSQEDAHVDAVDAAASASSAAVESADYDKWDESQSERNKKVFALVECLEGAAAGSFGWLALSYSLYTTKYAPEAVDQCAEKTRTDPRIVEFFKDLYGKKDKQALEGDSLPSGGLFGSWLGAPDAEGAPPSTSASASAPQAPKMQDADTGSVVQQTVQSNTATL